MQQESALLFVYGTLKRGLVNHHLLGEAAFAGEAEMPGVDLYDLGPFPMAIAGDGTASGELYRVDGERLLHLDRFEGAPRLYRRERLPLTDGRRVWIYLGLPHQVRHSPRLRNGRWPAASNPMRGAETEATQPEGPRTRLHATAALPASPVPLFAVCGALAGASRLISRRLALLVAWLLPIQAVVPGPAQAEATLAQCQRWQRSGGLERIVLGNAIGAAAYLTKVERFAESDPQHPQPLYAPADLERACDGWR